MESSSMYLILRCIYGSRRTRGIRVKRGWDISVGVAFLTTGGFKFQECLGNPTLKDAVAHLKVKKVS